MPCHIMPFLALPSGNASPPAKKTAKCARDAELTLPALQLQLVVAMSYVMCLAMRAQGESALQISNVWGQLGVGDVGTAWLRVEEAEVAVPA